MKAKTQKVSKKYGKFKLGRWVPFEIGVRKYESTYLKKTFESFSYCPKCGKQLKNAKTSTLLICRNCNTAIIVTTFREFQKRNSLDENGITLAHTFNGNIKEISEIGLIEGVHKCHYQ
jgi:protein-arginine kinase activator protein McsA